MRKIIDRITEILTGSLLVFMVLIACWQVFTRFVLQSPSTVTEEILRYRTYLVNHDRWGLCLREKPTSCYFIYY